LSKGGQISHLLFKMQRPELWKNLVVIYRPGGVQAGPFSGTMDRAPMVGSPQTQKEALIMKEKTTNSFAIISMSILLGTAVSVFAQEDKASVRPTREEITAKFDLDGDGQLSKEERSAMKQAGAAARQGGSQGKNGFGGAKGKNGHGGPKGKNGFGGAKGKNGHGGAEGKNGHGGAKGKNGHGAGGKQ
jgi:hypothetical protein